MHHPVSYDISVGLKILRAKVIKGISRNLQNTTEKSYVETGGKPSTWLPPGGLVEQESLQLSQTLFFLQPR